MPDVRDVIIIGSGPAGLTAAIYTARANLAPLVIEGEPSSHQRPARRPADAHHRGRELPRLPRRHHGPRADDALPRAGGPLRRRVPHRRRSPQVDFSEPPVPASCDPTRRASYRADAVIVSTGAQSLMLGLEAEQRLIGHGLSTCATCDGFFFRGQDIAVVGGGDSALEEATVPHQVRRQGHAHPPPRRAAGVEDHAGPGLRQRQDRVPLEHRRRRPRSATRKLEGVSVAQRQDRRGRRRSPVTGLFVAIGHRPEHRPVQGPARHGRQRLPHHPATARRTPTSRACSPAATCRTTSTARPSPPPARAAWPPSTPSAGSRPARTDAEHRRDHRDW